MGWDADKIMETGCGCGQCILPYRSVIFRPIISFYFCFIAGKPDEM